MCVSRGHCSAAGCTVAAQATLANVLHMRAPVRRSSTPAGTGRGGRVSPAECHAARAIMAGRPLQDSRQTNQSWMAYVVFSIGNAQMDSEVGLNYLGSKSCKWPGQWQAGSPHALWTFCTLGGIRCSLAALCGPEKAWPQRPGHGMHTCMLCVLGTPCSV